MNMNLEDAIFDISFSSFSLEGDESEIFLEMDQQSDGLLWDVIAD